MGEICGGVVGEACCQRSSHWGAPAEVACCEHDQATLGGVPLMEDPDPRDRGELPTLGDSPPSTTKGSCAKVRWDFFTSSWMALGRRLKPADVTPQEIAETDLKLPRDWEDLSWADKKDISFTVMERWAERKLLDATK